MTNTTDNKLSPREKELEEFRELIAVMAKILNVSKQDILNSISLFSNITP